MTRLSLFKSLAANFVAVLAIAAAVGAHAQSSAQAQNAARPLKVGVTAGPHAQIIDVVKQVAARQGLTLEIVEFNDYVQPNAALDQGDLDVNSYQHRPFLEQQIQNRGYRIVAIGETVTFPIGIYSKKVKSLKDVPEGGKIALPNDPTNGGRVLQLLAREGVITLKPDAGLHASLAEVVGNPRNIKLIEIDAAQLPRSLDDVDAAAINTNYALIAGLQPARDAIAIESAQSPYVNLIVVREKDKDRPEFQTLLVAYRSPEVKKFVIEEFKGAVVTTW